jgi:hypothetical protein
MNRRTFLCGCAAVGAGALPSRVGIAAQARGGGAAVAPVRIDTHGTLADASGIRARAPGA